jgi:hypothetical protein
VVKRFLAALICCGLLSLSGCSDDSSSSADPPSPTPTASTSDASPTPEPETPEEFVRRWVEVDREMQNSGDTQGFRSISKGCTPCKGLADQVEQIYDAGGYVKTDGLEILRLEAGSKDDNDQVSVHMWVNSTRTELRESADADVQQLPGGRLQYVITIRETAAGWNTVLLEGVAQ